MVDLEQLAREERNRYSREWARAHPDSRKETQRKYWLRKAQERLEREKGGQVDSEEVPTMDESTGEVVDNVN